MSAPTTARELARGELTRRILEAAARQLAEVGVGALSVRSVARELGMVPSAVYRYFPSRDALLTAVILDAYGDLADAAERAAEEAAGRPANERLTAITGAVRRWALDSPHRWALLFGTPVPGYHAPEATVAPYARIGAALASPLLELAPRSGAGEDDALGAAVAPVTEALSPGAPAQAVAGALAAWATVVGLISLELFGHFSNAVLDPDVLFAHAVTELARSAARTPS